MAGRVTIQDIADALGISRNTVSKAINNTGVLADSTRDRILQKAVEMGYKQFSYISFTEKDDGASRNRRAELTLTAQIGQQGLSQNGSSASPISSGTIAMLTTSFLNNSHFSSTMLDKFQSELSILGYGFVMFRVSQQELDSLSLPNSFNREMIDGIICFEIFTPAYSDMLCGLDIPILFVDAPAPVGGYDLKADRLLMENRSNIYALVGMLAKRGKQRIGFIGEKFHCLSFFERYMAYREALLLLGIPYLEEYCLTEYDPNPSTQFYRDYLKGRIQKMRQLPDAFLCANDFVALDVMQVFHDLNISIPDDILLCGFDDSPESRIASPQLSTIHIHSQIMGVSAVQLLMSRIKEPTMNFRTTYTETTLICRKSTGD